MWKISLKIMEAQDFPDGFDWIGELQVEENLEIEPEPEPNQPQVRIKEF